MYKIAQISNNDRRVLFRNTAQKSRLHEAIVEKDYWVCLTLDCLFHQCSQQKAFTFKGGTSLSKCYGLIKRFSEDIDLILDWRILGYGQNEPWESRSASKQEKFNKEANRRTEEFLRKNLLPELTEKLSSKLKADASFYIDPNDPQTICFQYPKIFNTNSVLQIIRLEIGALAAWTPAKSKVIVPYAAEYYPDVFDQKGTAILTVAAERTFWEKVTILHSEAHRPESSPMPARYSRHYYDLYCIAHSDNKQVAYEKRDLLKRVANFKLKFYPRKWANYESAILGTVCLVPPKYRLTGLENDYHKMSDMMFGKYPTFSELMDFMKELEDEINSL